jgi:hypothetical protein
MAKLFKINNLSTTRSVRPNSRHLIVPIMTNRQENTAGFCSAAEKAPIIYFENKSNLINRKKHVALLCESNKFSTFKLKHDGFKFTIDKNQKTAETNLLKDFEGLNRDQTVKALNEMMEKESLLNSFDRASKILKISKFKKLSGNIMKILGFDTFYTTVILETTTNSSLKNVESVVEFMKLFSKLVRNSYISKDPLSFEYLKSTSSSIKTDKDCVSWILDAERNGLTESQLLILFKELSQNLKVSLTETKTSDSSHKTTS